MATVEVELVFNGIWARFETCIRDAGPLFVARIDVNQESWVFEVFFEHYGNDLGMSPTDAIDAVLLPEGYQADHQEFVEGEYGDYVAVTGRRTDVAPERLGDWVLDDC